VPNADAEPPKDDAGTLRRRRRGPSGPERSSESGSSRPATRGRVVVAIVAAIVILDQATKAWAVANLKDGPAAIIGNDVELRLSFNSGSAFSLFRGFTPVLALLAIVIAVVLVRAVRRTDDTWTLVALALVLGGAIGNLADRVFRAPGFLRGHVVDFIGVGSFPTFNVADSAVTVGAVLLLVLAFVPRRRTS
jgi:signal peptidase II